MADKGTPATIDRKSLALVRRDARKTGCFLCKRILERMDRKRRLRDWPKGSSKEDGTVEFPVSGQLAHIDGLKGE